MGSLISHQRWRAAVLASAATFAMFCWQALTVHFNYGGNWTALFCIRPGMPVPRFLRSERLYLFQTGGGYDGMVYHLIAHDPWMRKGSPPAIAGVPHFYQRILVPALAWTLALGQDRWVHAAYFAVILGFVFLGVYWTSRFLSRIGLAPAWGLLFALTPAAIISMDRMTVDVALTALAAGFASYADDSPGPAVLAVLAAAALARETGLLIIAGYVIYLFTRRNIRGALLAASAALPALAWAVVLLRFGPPEAQKWGTWIPFAGFVDRVIHPSVYEVSRGANFGAQLFDLIALAGVALAWVQASRLLIRRRWNARTPAIYVLALAVVFIGSRPLWDDAFGFGRVLSPFLLLAALEYAAGGPVIAFLPIFLVDARISLNFLSQIAGVFRGVFGI